MKLYDLGTLPWKETQLIYHALARCNEQSLILCTPLEEYACVGFHQDPSFELDLDFCKKAKIGIFRREIGGGTVFLDGKQLFFQVILNRNKAPLDQRVLFQRYLTPIIKTLNDIGIEAKYHPISDLVVNGRKISGNGGGDIGNSKVMTGSILLDFDCDTMSRILNLPSEDFRKKVYESMEKHLTTVDKEIGYIPSLKELGALLIGNWEDKFGELEKGVLDPKINEIIKHLDMRFSSDEWLYKKVKQKRGRNIKIIEDVNLIYDIFSEVRMCVELKKDVIRNIEIYEDIPENSSIQLKRKLIGEKYNYDFVSNILEKNKKYTLN